MCCYSARVLGAIGIEYFTQCFFFGSADVSEKQELEIPIHA
jgi:hypothetical protein